MSLTNALGWSSLSTFLRVGLGFFSAKVSAVYLGPVGMVLVGQLNSFIQLTVGSIGSGASTAVVNLTAERSASRDSVRRVWSGALRLAVTLAAIAAVAIALMARPLSGWLFFSRDYWPVAIVAGIAVILAVADSVLTGALNGLKAPGTVARAGLASAIVEFVVFVSLTYTWGVWGALYAMTLVYGSRLAISCVVAFRSGLIRPSELIGTLDRQSLVEIARFYPMLLAHAVALPLGLLVVRSLVVGAVGLTQGGYLQAAWRLSDVYIAVLTTALGLYFMAQFSSLSDEAERGAMLRRTVAQMTGLTALAALGIFLLRDTVVRVVLTPEFLPMTALLPFQLLGDVMKMACYPLQMALVSRRRASAYIAQAVGAPAGYALCTYALIPPLGVQAAPVAYAATYVIVLCGLIVALRSTLSARALVPASIEREQLAV